MIELIGARKNRHFVPNHSSTPLVKRSNNTRASILENIPPGCVKQNIAMFSNINHNNPMVPQPLGQQLPTASLPVSQTLHIAHPLGLNTPISPQNVSQNDPGFDLNYSHPGIQNGPPPGFFQQNVDPSNMNNSFISHPTNGNNYSLPLNLNQHPLPHGHVSEADRIIRHVDQKYEELRRQIHEVQLLRSDFNSLASDVAILKSKAQLDVQKVAEILKESVTQAVVDNIGEDFGLKAIKDDIDKLTQYRTEMFYDCLRKDIAISNKRLIIFGKHNLSSLDLKDFLKRVVKNDKMRNLVDSLGFGRIGKKQDHLVSFDDVKSRQEFLRALDHSLIERGVRIERDIPLEMRDYYLKYKTRSKMLKSALGINTVIHFKDGNMNLLATGSEPSSNLDKNADFIIFTFKPSPVSKSSLRDKATKAEVSFSKVNANNDKFLNLPSANHCDIMNSSLFWRAKDYSMSTEKARELLVGACSKDYKDAIKYVTKDRGLFCITLNNSFDLNAVRTDLQSKVIGGESVRLLHWLD